METMREATRNALSGLFREASKPAEMQDGDYLGNDGLIYCGKCNKPKQTIIKLNSAVFGDKPPLRVRVICDCQKAEIEAREKDHERQKMLQRISRFRSMSLMDEKYRDAMFKMYVENENNQKARKVAGKYVDNIDKMLRDNQGIIFYGPVGTGKSYTAACIANELLDQCVPVIMTSFVKMLQKIQNGDEAEVLAMINNAKLLILDDLGTERSTDYALEKVYNIIDSRSRAALPMILTTNLELSEMMQTTDIRYRRIYDRIFETCYPVNIPGESFRRQEAAQRFDRMQKLMEG